MKQRYLFIDLLRFVAAFFMIQGHVFDALLSAQVKAHPFYYRHDFLHGFVAPTFLFASGVAYGASTIRRWDEHIVWGSRVAKRLIRFAALIGIGYALHLPFFSLQKTLAEASKESLQSLLQSDVLQCVGLTLLLLQLAVLILKRRVVFEWLVGIVAAAVVFVAPLTWSAELTGRLPEALVAYITPEGGSWFPLFPWAGYLLCGVLFGSRLLDSMSKTAAASAAVVLTAWGAMYLPWAIYPAHDFWKSNPSMFFVRLGVVSLVACGIFVIEKWWKTIPPVVLTMGRESLFIYIVHLMVVYGSVMNRGLSQWIGPTLPLPATIGVVLLLCAGIAAVTLWWSKVKRQHADVASWLATAAAVLFVFEFVRRPW